MFMFLQSRPCADTERASLTVPVGTFQVTDRGVKTRLRPPLARLSGYYPWSFVPVGIATMKMIVVGAGGGDSAAKLLKRLNITAEEQNAFDTDVGVVWEGPDVDSLSLSMSNLWCQSINSLMDWCEPLARECPYRSTSWDLTRVRQMDDSQLEQYVMSYLG